MSLIQHMRGVSKQLAIVAGIAVVTVAAATAAYAWGPNRPVYTMEKPADHVTFNSITNNPNYGDEREFVTIKDVTSGSQLTNNATLTPGHEYKVQIYVHNNAHSDLNASGKGVAKNTTVRAALPASVNGSETVDGFVSASNATPGTVYDSAALKSSGKVDLEFVNGSAMLHTNAQQTKLSDSVITTGVKVGDKDLSGDWRGCLQYAGAVTFNIKVKTPPKADFTMDKQVRKHSEGSGGWVEKYDAKVGETVDFIVRYKNTGSVTQENVVVKDTLPKGLSYVTGSTKLANGSYPDGKVVSDNVTTSGINIGTYAPGASAWVRFSAKVNAKTELACGVNTLKNVASVTTGSGTKSDDAVVVVDNGECEQPKEVKVCNPTTGEIITVDEKDADKYVPVDSDKCKEMEVCVIKDKSTKIIKKSDFDSEIYTTDFSKCEETPEVPEVPETPETPKTPSTPVELPHTGPADMVAKLAGLVSLTASTAYYVASRRQG